ncbi:MAG: hypothetical protein JO113_02710 [Candidatus Eremiobacteraeota bacterium]|nr:hypothetical protein [Candidatus Eremiobacteraeota bacterium]
MLLTRDLDDTIRRCEIAGIRSGIATASRLTPHVGVAGTEIAGGLAAFTGVDSPLSQVYGIVARVTGGDIAAITTFYASRGAAPRVFVSPLADPSLGLELAAAGYAPCEYENVLVSDAFEQHARADERIAAAADLDAWALASAQAFTGRDSLEPADVAIAKLIAYSAGVCSLEARENGAIVATAAMDFRDGCAGLFAGSTLPAFRGHGWQIAMTRDRIARAHNGGARFMRATARPMSVSERNLHRCGFVTLYTRALWERKR